MFILATLIIFTHPVLAVRQNYSIWPDGENHKHGQEVPSGAYRAKNLTSHFKTSFSCHPERVKDLNVSKIRDSSLRSE